MNFKIFVKLFILMVVFTSCGKMDNLTSFSKRKYLKNFPKQKQAEKVVYDKEEYVLDEPVLLSGLDDNPEIYLQGNKDNIVLNPDTICQLKGCSKLTWVLKEQRFHSYCNYHKCLIYDCENIKEKQENRYGEIGYDDLCSYHLKEEAKAKAKNEKEEGIAKEKCGYSMKEHFDFSTSTTFRKWRTKNTGCKNEAVLKDGSHTYCLHHLCLAEYCTNPKIFIELNDGRIGSRGYCKNHENRDLEIIQESISKGPENWKIKFTKILLGLLAVAVALVIVAAVFWFLYWSYIGLFASQYAVDWAAFQYKDLLLYIWVGIVIVGGIVGAVLSGSTVRFI